MRRHDTEVCVVSKRERETKKALLTDSAVEYERKKKKERERESKKERRKERKKERIEQNRI